MAIRRNRIQRMRPTALGTTRTVRLTPKGRAYLAEMRRRQAAEIVVRNAVETPALTAPGV